MDAPRAKDQREGEEPAKETEKKIKNERKSTVWCPERQVKRVQHGSTRSNVLGHVRGASRLSRQKDAHVGGAGKLRNSLAGRGERRRPGQGRLVLFRSFAAKKQDMSWQYQWAIEKDFVCLFVY